MYGDGIALRVTDWDSPLTIQGNEMTKQTARFDAKEKWDALTFENNISGELVVWTEMGLTGKPLLNVLNNTFA